MGVEFKPPTLEAIHFIASTMRVEDADEVWASHGHTPIEALQASVECSDFVVVVEVDGTPCTMLGLARRDVLSGIGTPWLLSSDEALKHKREFFKLSPSVVQEMLQICPHLRNYVHVKNKISIQWLKWVGFHMKDPTPYGIHGELFHPFELEKCDV